MLLYFSDSDRAAVDALPDVLTTEQYVTVTALLDKLRRCEDFDGSEAYLERLNEARSQIAAVQAEIDAINDEIREKLYPFEDVTLLDKPVVDALVERYDALSAYDKTKIERWEDVVKTQTKLDNLLRAIWIGAALVRRRRGACPASGQARPQAAQTQGGRNGSAGRAVCGRGRPYRGRRMR